MATFEFISRGHILSFWGTPDAAPNAPSTKWNIEKTQRYCIWCAIKCLFDATSDAELFGNCGRGCTLQEQTQQKPLHFLGLVWLGVVPWDNGTSYRRHSNPQFTPSELRIELRTCHTIYEVTSSARHNEKISGNVGKLSGIWITKGSKSWDAALPWCRPHPLFVGLLLSKTPSGDCLNEGASSARHSWSNARGVGLWWVGGWILKGHITHRQHS